MSVAGFTSGRIAPLPAPAPYREGLGDIQLFVCSSKKNKSLIMGTRDGLPESIGKYKVCGH